MKKVLFVFHLAYFFRFELNNIKLLIEQGFEVHCATNYDGYDELIESLKPYNIVNHQVDFIRSPFSNKNIKAYKQLNQVFASIHFEIVHCHTPMGGVLARLAARKYRELGTKVIYTAHGFHFFNGAPIKNWLLYYPMEKYLSRFTDLLITINREDYSRAKSKFYMKKIELIPGVGIDLDKFSTNNKIESLKYRELFNIPKEGIWFLSVGEVNANKNHQLVIKALSQLANKNIYYTIVGVGDIEAKVNSLIKKLNLESNVKLLGYRTDVANICSSADYYIFPSYREGLSVALMEAMASSLPIACSRIRGNIDLIDDTKGGFLFDSHSVKDCKNSIIKLLTSDKATLGTYNKEKIKNFDIITVEQKMSGIYKSLSNSEML